MGTPTQEITRDILVALLSHAGGSNLATRLVENPAMIGELFKAVEKAVRETTEADDVEGPASHDRP